MTGQDQPVRYDPVNRTYRPVSRLEEAVQNFQRAVEGDYIILENPAKDLVAPTAVNQQAVDLIRGRKVIIPGPWSEALWPGQVATVIEGHRLRSNQYLIAIVYNAEEAKKNWESTVVVAQTETTGESLTGGNTDSTNQSVAPENAAKVSADKKQDNHPRGLSKPDSFAVGTRIVIRGSDVSFYIPCTGVEVLRDENNKYVREAVTLEQLEYCCLIDENGKKEYPRGPKVVFPKPTQIFDEDSKKRRKFKPIELNTINGIHLKVTANFEGPDIESGPVDGVYATRNFLEGEELFVTGKTLSIYYPREELAIIEYGQGNKKHFSTAIPKGEGRYLINRETGEIRLVRGPQMLLPDPRNQILVRRILSDSECALWYPGNQAAIEYNRELAQAMAESPSGRSGVVSEGDWRKRQARGGMTKGFSAATGTAVESLGVMNDFSPEDIGDEGGAGATLSRGTRYTQPRQLTLNTKFDGVPRIEVWPGYAVLVVGASGNRKVVEGPEIVLLEYDEKLGFMELSTGKPKTSDKLVKTSYLCIQNNQVGDVINFESSDHVRGSIKISLRVNFEGETESEKLRWFATDNYVKFLTDHVRSMIGGLTKRKTIAEIKSDYVNLVRDQILGPRSNAAVDVATDGVSQPLNTSRPGLYFSANGMRVTEVEVLDLNLSDQGIAKLLDNAQQQVVRTNIEISQAQKELDATKERERIAQAVLVAQARTKSQRLELERAATQDEISLVEAQFAVALKRLEGQFSQTKSNQVSLDFVSQAELARGKAESEHQLAIDKSRQDLEVAKIQAETQAAVERFTAAKDGLYEIFVSLGRDDIAAKLAQATNIERFLSGETVGSSIANILAVVPGIQTFFERGTAAQEARNATVNNRLANRETAPKK
jgi:major vault protein